MMNNKSIVFVISLFANGGLEKVFIDDASILTKNGIKTYLFALKYESDLELPKTVVIIKTLREAINKKKAGSKIVCFTTDWKGSLVSSLISKEYISWIHGNPYTMKSARTARLNFYLLKKSDKIICICKEQVEILEKFGIRADYRIIPNAINKHTIERLSKERIDYNSKFILTTARFDLGTKDFYTLIDAYCILSEEIKRKYKLVLIGDGPDKEAVSSYVKKKKLDDYVYLPGFQRNPYAWMKKSDLFVYSSTSEGFPMSVLEAMICRCPIIITNYHTGSREASNNGRNCKVVEIGDSNAMAREIVSIIHDRGKTNEMIGNAYLYASGFDISCVESELVALFEE